MAKLARRFNDNVEGRFFVDEACIDCDLCRQTASNFFSRSAIGNTGHSIVHRQPATPEEVAICEDALQACPVDAIGDCGETWAASSDGAVTAAQAEEALSYS